MVNAKVPELLPTVNVSLSLHPVDVWVAVTVYVPSDKPDTSSVVAPLDQLNV